jgi:uncharacterized protein (TIGR03118 family)
MSLSIRRSVRERAAHYGTSPAALLILVLLPLASCGGYSGGATTMTLTPTVTISAQPTTITAGQAVTLTWSSTNAATCTASGGWSGNEPTSGTQAVTPAATGNSFTLTCQAPNGSGYMGGAGATTSMAATVTVNPASTYTATALVTDTSGRGAVTTDANLVNPWGIVFGPNTPVWVANNHSATSTLYDGNGKAQPPSGPLVVQLPDSGADTFDPTGVVFNATSDFVVTSAGHSAAARFLYTGEGGSIAGWAPTVDLTHAVIMYTDTGGAVYKGLVLANNGTANFLYATDFHNNKVDVFDTTYTRQTSSATSFAFKDTTMPAGYAPFGIQAIQNGAGNTFQIYVSYAMQQTGSDDNANGAGLGLIDVYDANGTFVKHLVASGGALNAPWGMALAPADFGTFANMLMVGNFGDGKINGYDPSTGAVMGAVLDSTGAAFDSPGLWGIAFGNGAANQPRNTLFYAAGPNDEANGVYGRIDLGGPPTLNAPPSVLLTLPPPGNLTGTVSLTATATDSVAIAKIQFFANTNTLIGTATTSPYTVQWDTTTIANGSVSLTAIATDVDGNVGSSSAVTVTVAN